MYKLLIHYTGRIVFCTTQLCNMMTTKYWNKIKIIQFCASFLMLRALLKIE